jgi:TANFOR domain-containing protein
MNRTHDIRMKQNRKVLKWFIAGILWMAAMFQSTNVQARFIYPVTASLQLVPPYSVYLPDYAAPGNDKLRVILTLNDLTQPSYTVRLRLKVEFNGQVIMQTDPAYRASPITILPGMPQIITGTQLNELLVSDHMQFMNGFNRENYERTKALPEGAYRICVTAYDYNRSDEVAVSNDGCNIFFFQKNEAPLLNYPLCNTRVERKEPQFLTFTWSIRNTPSFVTGSTGTGYRFELFEVRPAGSNAEYIVRSSTPIYSVTTDAAMLTYGPAMPKLLDSMQYVWRVQAFDKSGRDAYQNNGYSQACVFTYGGVDPFVVNNIGKAELLGDALGERSGKWWWHLTNTQTVDGWNIQYRKKGDSTNKGTAYSWNKQYLADTLFHLFNLEPDNSYEAQVQPVIKGINGFWSEMVPLHTFPKRVYECGKNDTANNGLGAAAAGQPLNTAVAGMVVRVGSFDMQLLDVQGGNGRFSGYGAVATPLLGMRLNVKFTDVQINDRLQLTQGEVVALSDGIDAWIKDRTKVNHDVSTIKDWKETMPDFDTASLATLKDFATELLGISPGVWTDTYVFTDQERKDVMAAIQEVQAAMKDLNDSDPSNDAAAEKKLRGALNKAEPMLKKLSENIGKGVLVKLGLTRKKLYKSIVSGYVKELLAASSTAFIDMKRIGQLPAHGPHINDETKWRAALPACMRSLDADKQKELGGYLQQKISTDAGWDEYVESLQSIISKQQEDETFFSNTEKAIDSSATTGTEVSVESWAGANASKWNDAWERLCTYVMTDFNVTESNSMAVGGSVDFSELSLPSNIYVFQYGVQIQFMKNIEYKGGGIKLDGKEYRPLFASGSHKFLGFYDVTVLATVPKEKDNTYKVESLDAGKGWLDKANYEVVSELTQTYAREFFEDIQKSDGIDRPKALELARLLDKVNQSVYNEYLNLAWKDRTEQEAGLYEMGFALSTVDQFEAALAEFIYIVKHKVEALQKATKEWYTTSNKQSEIRDKILKRILWRFDDKDYLALSNAQRDSVMKILVAGNLHSWNLGDQIAMKLATRVPDDQVKNWMETLAKGDRLKKLFGGVDGDEFSEMIIWLSTAVMKNFKRPADFTPEEAVLSGRYVPFKEGLFTGYVLENWLDDNGNINLSSRPQFTIDKQNAYGIKATDWVYITFRSPFTLNDKIKYKKNARLPMPALMAYALFNEEKNRRWWDAGKFTLDVALLAIGVGEISAAAQATSKVEKIIRVTKAVADMAVGLGDIVISDVLSNKLSETKEGQEFLETWNTIQLYYGLGSVGTEVGLYARKLYKQGKIWKEMEKEMADEMDKVMKDVEAQTSILNKGDDLDAGWQFWSDYPKKVINGEEYAVVGNRYYSHEAVDAMTPVGYGAGKSGVVAQGVNPRTVEGIIQTEKEVADGAKSYFDNFDVIVVTEDNGSIVRGVYKITEQANPGTLQVFERKATDIGLGLKQGSMSYEASKIEQQVAKARIAQMPSTTKGNYAYLNGKVSGIDSDIKTAWKSAEVARDEPQIFEAIEWAGGSPTPFLRNVCSEYKMLNWMAKQLKADAQLGRVYTDVVGELKIVSKLDYCPSCRGIIKQFNEMFPNVKLILFNGLK